MRNPLERSVTAARPRSEYKNLEYWKPGDGCRGNVELGPLCAGVIIVFQADG